MVVILAIGTAMLWTVQRIMAVSANHADALAKADHQGHQVAVSAAAIDSPFMRQLVPRKRKVVHPKDLSAYLAVHEYKVRAREAAAEEKAFATAAAATTAHEAIHKSTKVNEPV